MLVEQGQKIPHIHSTQGIYLRFPGWLSGLKFTWVGFNHDLEFLATHDRFKGLSPFFQGEFLGNHLIDLDGSLIQEMDGNRPVKWILRTTAHILDFSLNDGFGVQFDVFFGKKSNLDKASAFFDEGKNLVDCWCRTRSIIGLVHPVTVIRTVKPWKPVSASAWLVSA